MRGIKAWPERGRASALSFSACWQRRAWQAHQADAECEKWRSSREEADEIYKACNKCEILKPILKSVLALRRGVASHHRGERH